MNNLEKITEAFDMDYSATVNFEDWQGLQYIKRHYLEESEKWVYLFTEDSVDGWIETSFIDDVEITGYKYMGELGGGKGIPEGQKFRVNKTEEIFEVETVNNGMVNLIAYDPTPNGRQIRIRRSYDKSEIEPYFS